MQKQEKCRQIENNNVEGSFSFYFDMSNLNKQKTSRYAIYLILYF